MGKFYMAATQKYGGKFRAFVIAATRYDNLVHVLTGYGGIVIVNLCKTKCEAEAVVDDWNESFRENGTYMYA